MRKKFSQNIGPTLPGFETCESVTSTTSHLLTSSPAASPVSLTASQESAKPAKTSATFGLTSTALFATLDRVGCWLKTYLGCFQAKMDGSLEEYSGTWPRHATMLNGACYRLRNLERHTSENEFSSWPTPQSRDYRAGDAPDTPRMQRKREQGWSANLNDVVLWPTFLSSEATHGGPNQKNSAGKPTLTALVHQLWPTPAACVANDGEGLETWEARRQKAKAQKKNGNGFGTPLTIAVQMWPTPVANDAKNATLPPGTESRDSVPGSLRRAGYVGNLNPAWVESLMGFPEGWVSIDGLQDQESNNTNGKPLESPQKSLHIA